MAVIYIYAAYFQEIGSKTSVRDTHCTIDGASKTAQVAFSLPKKSHDGTSAYNCNLKMLVDLRAMKLRYATM